MASTAVRYTLAFVLLDVIITTILYIHGSQFSLVREELLNFSALSSLLDLWGTVLLRSALLLGACIGVSRNRDEGPRRVEKATTAVVLTAMSINTYAVAKLLLLSELRPLAQQPWALSLLCWTFASSLGLLLPWKLLAKVAQPGRGRSSSRGGCEDAEKLVDAESEGEDSAEGRQEQKRPNSRATLGRLLAFSRKDAGLLCVATLFLLIFAACKCGREE